MTEENTATNEKPDRENLKFLSLGIVSDLSRLLAEQGFGQQPIDIVEALVFAMFIVADTYSLAKPEKDKAIEVINSFYEDMQTHFINKVLIKDYQIADEEQIRAIADKFYDLSRGRFGEYREKFQADISEPGALSCPHTVNYFLDQLFIQPLTDQEKIHLMGAVSDKIIYLWAACVESFKG